MLTKLSAEERVVFENRLRVYNIDHPPTAAMPDLLDETDRTSLATVESGDVITLELPTDQVQRGRLAIQRHLRPRGLTAYFYPNPLVPPAIGMEALYAYILPRGDP